MTVKAANWNKFNETIYGSRFACAYVVGGNPGETKARLLPGAETWIKWRDCVNDGTYWCDPGGVSYYTVLGITAFDSTHSNVLNPPYVYVSPDIFNDEGLAVCGMAYY